MADFGVVTTGSCVTHGLLVQQQKGVRLSLDTLLVVREFDSMSLPSQQSCYKTLFLSILRHTERTFFFCDSSNWPVTQIFKYDNSLQI